MFLKYLMYLKFEKVLKNPPNHLNLMYLMFHLNLKNRLNLMYR
jgi:hypothetical protein